MTTNEFETAFSAFLEGPVYEAAEQALFELARAAFTAGWRAAGRNVPQDAPTGRLPRKTET